AAKLQLKPEDVEKHRLYLQIGTAAILCKTGVALAGTIYDKLSERDMNARQKEIDAAVNEADPVTRDYLLPESRKPGRITTEPEYRDGDKTCKQVVDRFADVEHGDPAIAIYCKSGNGDYELEY